MQHPVTKMIRLPPRRAAAATGLASLLWVAAALAQPTWEEAPAQDAPTEGATEPPGASAEPEPPPPPEPTPAPSERPSRPVPPPPPPFDETDTRPQASGARSDRDIDLQTQAPAPAQQRTRHLHDGLYLRMTTGLDFAAAAAEFDDGSKISMNGGAFTMGTLLGGTPTPGLAIGGGMWIGSVDEPKTDYDVDGDGPYEPTGGLVYGIIGPFIDVHPNPRRGLHFGGAFGVGFMVLPENNAVDALSALEPEDQPDAMQSDRTREERRVSAGGAFTLFGGYDFWISANWSMGPMLRISVIRARQDLALEYDSERPASAYDAHVQSVALLFSALHH